MRPLGPRNFKLAPSGGVIPPTRAWALVHLSDSVPGTHRVARRIHQQAGDADEMVSFAPSGNTDQGVYHVCECLGGKPIRGAKAIGERPTPTGVGCIIDRSFLGWIRVEAYMLEPERW